jgi:hypothetical protein
MTEIMLNRNRNSDRIFSYSRFLIKIIIKMYLHISVLYLFLNIIIFLKYMKISGLTHPR